MVGAAPDGATEPDSPETSDFVPSPNHGERTGGRRPDILLLHYTGMPSAAEALGRMCDPLAAVSAHYLVFEDGRIVQLVRESRRAWHAGAGCWAGERDVNSASIGVEIGNAGHAGGLPPYPDRQIEAVIRLARDVVGRWRIAPDRVLAHSDVAPARKEDPGERFPWNRLARAGVGRWVEPAPLDGAGQPASEPIGAIQKLLASYGFDLAPTGERDGATAAAVAAFQRRFRQGRVDGVADASTVDTLRRFLARRDAEPPSGAT